MKTIKSKREMWIKMKKAVRSAPFFIFHFSLFILFCISCQKQEIQNSEPTPVSFSTQIATRTTTTGDVTSWLATDRVGIFMVTTGGALPTNIVGGATAGADNRQYQPSTEAASSALTPVAAADKIYYPPTGNVDFIAYYPWRTTPASDPYMYKVSVADQSTATKQAGVDLLWVKKTGVQKSTSAVTLGFNHKLSRITLNVMNGTGLTDGDISAIAAANVSIGGMPVAADIALQTGVLTPGAASATPFSPLKAPAATAGFDATFSAILIPQAASAYAGRTVSFTVGTDTYTWTIPLATAFAAGSHYTYPVTVSKTGITVGAPTITKWTGTGATPTDMGIPSQIPIPMVFIPAGTFIMGSPIGEPSRFSDETQHSVTLTKDFYMSKYEITFAQYDAFCDATGRTKPSDSGWGRGDRPVINVNWNDAKAYADWIGGSLPTEAQWEYACRGSYSNKATETATLPFGIGTGRKLTNDMANFFTYWPYDLDHTTAGEYYDDLGTNYQAKTTPVGTYSANSYGLYDMHGNVWEWCSDWYDSKYGSQNATDPATDPIGLTTANAIRVRRGGGWGNNTHICRSAYRSYDTPGSAYNFVGFRVVFVQ